MFQVTCSMGSAEMVEWMLQNYAEEININYQDNLGRSALHMACKAGNNNIVKLLLDLRQPAKVDTELRTSGGQTCLMYAAMSGEMFTLAECLNRGMNPFHTDKLRWTVADFAAKFQNV